MVSPGLEVLQQLVSQLKPSYTVQTHDEEKHASAFVSRFARITRFDDLQLCQHPWLADKWLQLPNYEAVSL